MRSILVALLIWAFALAQTQPRTLRESGLDNQKLNDIYRTDWPIDILERKVNYELMTVVDDRLERIPNKDLRNEIRNFVVRHLRQCIGESYYEQSSCVMRATILYQQFT